MDNSKESMPTISTYKRQLDGTYKLTGQRKLKKYSNHKEYTIENDDDWQFGTHWSRDGKA